MAFATPLNKVSATLATAHVVGDGQLALGAGQGAAFGSPSPSAPVRLTTLDNPGRTETIHGIYEVTGRTGDVLTGLTPVEGSSDVALSSGVTIEVRVTAGTIAELQSAIVALPVVAAAWRDGTGAPSSGLGADGDYYLDDATGFVYARAAGSYSHVATILGPAGSQGIQGIQGIQGPAGVVTASSPLNLSAGNIAIVAASGSVVLASPAGGALGAIVERALVSSDIPNLDASKVTTGVPTGVLKGSAGVLAAGVAGTDYLDPTHGIALAVPGVIFTTPVSGSGTNSLTLALVNQAANTGLLGPTSGGAAAPTFRALVAADVPVMVGDAGAGGAKGAVPAPAIGDATHYLRGDGTWTAPSGQPRTLASGLYYFCVPTTNTGTLNSGTGTLRLAPFWVSFPITLSRIGAEVTSAGDVGSVVRLGIYRDNGSGYPGALLLDAGTIDGHSPTVQEIAISQALPLGLYWVGAVVQLVTTTQPTIRSIGTNLSGVDVGLPSIPTAGQVTGGYIATGVTGALSGADPFPATVTPNQNTARVFIKVQ